MEQIGIEKQIKRIELVKFIYSLFPNKDLINWKGNFEKTFIYNGSENIEHENIESDFPGFAIQIESNENESNESEFQTVITLYRTEQKHIEERELFLALKISDKFKCRTIINGPEKLADHPYLSLVIENGKIFEADDSGTEWGGDGTNDKVKIIKEIKLMKMDFDKNGNLKASC